MALSRNEIKFIRSLQEKKQRETHSLFVVEGVKLVEELLQQEGFRIETLVYTENYTGKIPANLPAKLIPESDLQRISGLVTPNRILAVVHYPETRKTPHQDENMVLYLDDVKDPGNLGTILRTADWFGIRTVISSETTVDLFNPKVIQASMGAVYRIQFSRGNHHSLEQLNAQGFQLLGADLQGENLFSYTFPTRCVLVMGSESHGISTDIKNLLNKSITIPSFGETESLNVAMATGIILSHYRRQLSSGAKPNL